MIQEKELLGVVAKLNLGLNRDRVAKPSLGACISVYDVKENIVRDECFVCDLPFDSLSVTINGKKHKDWLEQMIKTEWIQGFPVGYVNKVVKIKYHYDDKSIETETIPVPPEENEGEGISEPAAIVPDQLPVSKSNPELNSNATTSAEPISYQRAELIVSEIDFLDYPDGFTLHSNSKTSNTWMYRPDVFEFSTPYEVTLERLDNYPDECVNISGQGELIATTKNELEQVFGAPVDFAVDKSVYEWILKMTATHSTMNDFGQVETYRESYLLTVYDYSKGAGIEPDELYHYQIGGIPMLEGDEENPMISGNDVYTEMPLKLFKAIVAHKILELRNNANKE